MLPDLWMWSTEVFGHWQLWLSGGGLGGAIVLAVYFWERLRGKTMPNRNYVFIFVVVFLFAASFGAWSDEHHNRIAAETAVATNRVENTPSLIPVPEARAITDVGEEKKNSVLVVIMTIKNL